jgi:hypothetical protein
VLSKDGAKPLFPPPNIIKAKQLKPLVPQKHPVIVAKQNQETFEILKKFFTKPLPQHTPAELKKMHYEIIEDMIQFEEKFLDSHKQHVGAMKETLEKEKHELMVVEDPQSSIEAYLRNSEEILNRELEMTRALQKQLSMFQKYLSEEKIFAKRFIIPEDKKNNTNNPSHSNGGRDHSFEISDTQKLQRLSSGSLLLDD